MNPDITNQLIGSASTDCLTLGCYPYTYVNSGTTISVEKLPGGFIITANGRREIVATPEALTAYLQRWGEGK